MVEEMKGEARAGFNEGGAPSPQLLEKVYREAAQQLSGRGDEPCYPVLLEKEVTKRIVGLDMPWIRCTHLRISVKWEIEEVGGRRLENRAKYSLEENYPGYIRLEYDTDGGDRINSFRIGGPSPQNIDHVDAQLTEVSAVFHVYSGPDILEGRVNTSDPSDFTINKGTGQPDADIAISNSPHLGRCEVSIRSSNIIPGPRLVKYPVAEILETTAGGTLRVTEGDVSVEDVQRGLREGRLVKQFSVHESIDLTGFPQMGVAFKREGSATVQIDFGSVGERWRVTVDTTNIMGYGMDDRFFGIQVETERIIEVLIEDGEFKGAHGRTSFKSVKPYSTPPDLYRCEEVVTEVAGTGRAVEAEQYDQVRNAKRFNPPMNPGDEALRDEWLKIQLNKTPYAFPPEYSLKGTKSGARLELLLPRDSGYVVAHRCDPGDAFIREWLQRWRSRWTAHGRWTSEDYDRFIFPESVTVVLEDGWSGEGRYTTSYLGPNEGWRMCPEGTPGGRTGNIDRIKVQRVK